MIVHTFLILLILIRKPIKKYKNWIHHFNQKLLYENLIWNKFITKILDQSLFFFFAFDFGMNHFNFGFSYFNDKIVIWYALCTLPIEISFYFIYLIQNLKKKNKMARKVLILIIISVFNNIWKYCDILLLPKLFFKWGKYYFIEIVLLLYNLIKNRLFCRLFHWNGFIYFCSADSFLKYFRVSFQLTKSI